MSKISSQANKATAHKETSSKSPLIEVKKTFNAPIERVWKAWSQVDLVQQWWGPQGFSSPSAKIDFRVGGKYIFAMRDPQGKVMWSTGVYEEIIPNKKIICSDQFSDQDGNVLTPKEAGMDEWEGVGKTYFTVEFTQEGSLKTSILLSHEGLPQNMHDDCIDGWSSSLDKLKKLVEKN